MFVTAGPPGLNVMPATGSGMMADTHGSTGQAGEALTARAVRSPSPDA